MKLELGSGHRPTPGYEHNDLYAWDHIEHVGAPWLLELPDASLDEVLALAFVEHMTYDQARDLFRNVLRMLQPDAAFYFDVPDYPVWARYYVDLMGGYDAPLSLDHVRRTLFGWQRWPGDEHLYGWDTDLLLEVLHDTGYSRVMFGVDPFKERAHRQRFHRPEDAHLYVCAVR
jgi:predicted SAM-dependent methyltransferase